MSERDQTATEPDLAAPADAIEDASQECGNCGGLGIVAGCFEDTCCGADCDPEDAENCCDPRPCDWCRPRKKRSVINAG